MKFLLLILNLFFSVLTFAQKKDFRSFIPNGYDTLYGGIAVGDLNKDGIQDMVLALYPAWENDSDWMTKSDNDTLPQRLLIVLFGSKNGFIQVAKSTKAILCRNCGGIFGDPFSGVAIAGNILEINHYGGSNWRWSYEHKFRFQNNDFYLIGQTTDSYWDVQHCDALHDFAGTDYEDIDFLTGQYETKKISEDCKLLEHKKGKMKIQPLVSLSKFEIDN